MEDNFARALIIFDQAVSPTYLIVVMTPSESEMNDSYRIQVSVFDVPSLSLRKTFSIDTPVLPLDADLSAYFSPTLKKLVFYGQRKELACYMLSLIDVEIGVGTSQLFPNIHNLVYVGGKEVIVSITIDGWVQCKGLEEMEMDIKKYGDGATTFDGRTDTAWISEGWKRLMHVPPSFLPCYESGIAVHEKGELSYVGDFGKRLVQISLEW